MYYLRHLSFYYFTLTCNQGGGTWPNSTMMRLVPHSTALTRWFYHPFSLAKILSNYHQKSQNTSPQPLFSARLDLWKHPLLLDFTMEVQLVKNTPKTWKMAEPVGGFWSTPPQACNVCVCIEPSHTVDQFIAWMDIYATLLLQDKRYRVFGICSNAFYPYTTRKLDLIVHVTHTLIVKFQIWDHV